MRLDALITKYMGETAAKLRQIFDAISEMRGIYFFDELDAIGSQRGLANDVGEIRRVLNSFGHDHRLGQNRRSLDGAELAKRNPGSSWLKG